MRKNLLESLVIIALAESSICQGAEMQQDSYKIIDTGAILSASQAEKATLTRPMIEASPPFWTPSTDDVARLERALPSYIRSANIPSAGKIFASIGNYRRQYIGYTKDGEKWILVNAFCHEYWRKAIHGITISCLYLMVAHAFFEHDVHDQFEMIRSAVKNPIMAIAAITAATIKNR